MKRLTLKIVQKAFKKHLKTFFRSSSDSISHISPTAVVHASCRFFPPGARETRAEPKGDHTKVKVFFGAPGRVKILADLRAQEMP